MTNKKPKKLKTNPEETKKVKKITGRMVIFVVVGLFILLLVSTVVTSGLIAVIAQYWHVEEDNSVLFALVALAISIVVGFALSFAYSALMIKSIGPYLNALQKIASFDFTTRITKDTPVFSGMGLADNFNEMAKQLQSVETLREDFISDFSHEFKTPIVSISGFATLLKNPDLTSEEREEYLNVIIDESARLVHLSESVLMLTRLDSQTIVNERFLLDEQLRQSVLLFEHASSQKKIEFSLDMEEISVTNCKQLLSQVWVNLLSNAVKFTPEGGKIEIFAQKQHGVVTVCIKDNGCGMDEYTQKNMFNKFYQGERSHATEGNGLGLSIVKKICDLLEIKIEVQSKLGEGTAFTLTFSEEPAVKDHTVISKQQ